MLLWVVVILVLFCIWISTKRPSWSPNGPVLLPLVGNLFSIDFQRPHHTFEQWAQRFGSICHCRLGVQDLIILNDPILIQEAFSKPEITSRPDTELFRFVTGGEGLVTSSGVLWQETRRLALHNLRNMGMGKSKLEGFIHTQIKDFMEEILEKNCGRAIELGFSLNVAIVNIIWRMIASEELGLNDQRAEEIMRWMEQSVGFGEKLALFDFFPWISSIIPRNIIDPANTEETVKERLRRTFLPTVEQHRTELETDSEPRDFIDALLQEQLKRPDLITDWHIVISIGDLFFAGNETTATTLRWAFCFLCQFPDVQQRVQEEIDAVVGRHRPPGLSDRVNMPYTEAVLLEIHRMATIAPRGLPHVTTAPAAVGGFQLPAGVQIVSNLFHVHYDKSLFPDPHQFNPERFIDTNGKFKPNRNVMPFSVGRRQCLGEGLARAELFLFLTCFLQSFSFRWPEGFSHDLSEGGDMALTRKPTAYTLIPEKR